MQKKYHFLSGFPRSGNTALAALLEQHPEIYVGPLSYAQDILRVLYMSVFEFDNFLVSEQTDKFFNVTSKIFDNYYSAIDKPVVIDRHKDVGLPDYLGRIKKNVANEPKIIFTYRPILEVLASFIKLAEEDTSDVNWLDSQLKNNWGYSTVRDLNEARCEWLMRPGGQIDNGITSLINLLKFENRKNLFLLNYDDLVNKPADIMQALYDFCEVDFFVNDFKNIKKNHLDLDTHIRMPANLHEVKSNLEKTQYDLTSFLPPTIIDRYKNYTPWKEA